MTRRPVLAPRANENVLFPERGQAADDNTASNRRREIARRRHCASRTLQWPSTCLLKHDRASSGGRARRAADGGQLRLGGSYQWVSKRSPVGCW